MGKKTRGRVYTMNLASEIRGHLKYIQDNCPTFSTLVGTIRGIIMIYAEILRMQLEAEETGSRLYLLVRDKKGGVVSSSKLNLRR